MTETSHARGRLISLLGLALQAAAVIAAFGLSASVSSRGLFELAWYFSGGLWVWLIAALVFHQRVLAHLEALDLEALRREKAAVRSESIFTEEGGAALTLRVAAQRLEWMQRWLVPAFGLVIAAYLSVVGLWRWTTLRGASALAGEMTELVRPELALIVLSMAMIAQFFLARYASGLGRLPEARLLRACGSFTFGNALAAMALCVCFGAVLYAPGLSAWERVAAHAIPVVMLILGVEMLVNFVADRYRPRVPGTEARAAFDSRLLGVIAEPGGIAHSLAEAVNYQFGFRVSQTWFYQLLQRTLAPLLLVGASALWLLTCIVIVGPDQRAIVERFGRQLEPERPLTPGVYLKWPAPVSRARIFNTDEIQQFFIGYRVGDQPAADGSAALELWTDDKHSGRDHFDFLLAPTPASAGAAAPRSATAPGEAGAAPVRAPVHMARAEVFVQYRIDANRLLEYTRSHEDPHAALRAVAWDEVSRLFASTHVDALLGDEIEPAGRELRERLDRRARELGLGLEIVRAGLPKVHPEKRVSEAFRGVVSAQMERIAEIRKARVAENEVLSKVAGDRRRALALAEALEHVERIELDLAEAEAALRDASAPAAGHDARDLSALDAAQTSRVEALWRLSGARRQHEEVESDFELGLGRTVEEGRRTAALVADAEQALGSAEAALEAAAGPVRTELSRRYGEAAADALVSRHLARVALSFWTGRLEMYLVGLEGDAAVALSRAQARRWTEELRAASVMTRVSSERAAFAAAPEIYMVRGYLDVLTNGIRGARKYFLAFDPAGRTVHLRLNTEDQGRPALADIPTTPGR